MIFRKPPPPPPSGKRPPEPWHAVSVVPGTGPCSAVMKDRDKRFLAAQAPPIPLRECAWPWRCKCVYRHYADRRAGTRRASDRGILGRYPGVERRHARGRRGEDSAEQ